MIGRVLEGGRGGSGWSLAGRWLAEMALGRYPMWNKRGTGWRLAFRGAADTDNGRRSAATTRAPNNPRSHAVQYDPPCKDTAAVRRVLVSKPSLHTRDLHISRDEPHTCLL